MSLISIYIFHYQISHISNTHNSSLTTDLFIYLARIQASFYIFLNTSLSLIEVFSNGAKHSLLRILSHYYLFCSLFTPSTLATTP